MNRRPLVWVAVLLAALAAAQLLNLLLVGSRPLRVFNSNLLQLSSALAAAVLLTILAVRLKPDRGRSSVAWSLMTAALWSWTAGMAGFTYLEVVLGRHAYPGFPDVFFLAFYPLAIIALLVLPREPLSRREKLDSAIDIAALAVLTSMVIWQFNIAELLRDLLAHPSLASRFSLAYSLLDLMLLWVVFVILVQRVVRSSQFAPMLTLVLGCLCLATADIMQAHITLYTAFVSGSIADLGWVLFSVFVGLSATYRLAALGATGPGVPSPRLSSVGRTILVVSVTYVWLGVMFVLLAWRVLQPPGANPQLLIAGGLIIFALALYRQIRGIKDYARVCELLEQAYEELETRVRERTAELQRQTEQLRETELRFYSVLEGVDSIAIQGYRPDGRVTFWNKTSERLYGFTATEMIGQDLVEMLHTPETRGEERRIMAEAVRTGIVPSGVELPMRRRDGSVFWVYASRVLISLPGKEPEFFCFDVDITERRQAEQALKLTQFSVDRASDAAFWMDSEGRFVYVNQAACASLGYTREEMLSMTVFDIDPDFTREDWARTWPAVEQQGSITLETVHRTKDGRVFPVEISANFLEYGGKKYDFAFARNISERKQAEEDKRRFYRETIKSVTQGKLDLITAEEVSQYLDSADLVADVVCATNAGDVRREMVAFCESRGLGPDRLGLFEVAIGEALANTIKHANGGTAYAGVHNSYIWCAISDSGPGISALTVPAATLRMGFSTKSSLGMGYTIMMDASDRVMLCTSPEGTTVILSVSTKPKPSPLLRPVWDESADA